MRGLDRQCARARSSGRARRQRNGPAPAAIAEHQPDRAVLFRFCGEMAVEPGRIHQRRLPFPFLGPDMQPHRGAAVLIGQHIRLRRPDRADHPCPGHRIGRGDKILPAGAQPHCRAVLVRGACGFAMDRLDKIRGDQQRRGVGIGPWPERGGQGVGQFDPGQVARQRMGGVRRIRHPARPADFGQRRDARHMGRAPLHQRDAPAGQQMRPPAPQQQLAHALRQDGIPRAGPCRQPQPPPVGIALQARVPCRVQQGGRPAGEGGGDPAHALFAHEARACGQKSRAAGRQVHGDDGPGRSAIVQRQAKGGGMAGQRQPFARGVDKGFLRDAILMQRQHLGMMGQ